MNRKCVNISIETRVEQFQKQATNLLQTYCSWFDFVTGWKSESDMMGRGITVLIVALAFVTTLAFVNQLLLSLKLALVAWL